MDQIYLKIITDIKCLVYIDSEFVQVTEKDTILKLPLRMGEYFVQIVSAENKDLSIKQIVSLEYDRIIQVDFERYLSEHLDLIRDADIEYKQDDKSFYNLILNKAITTSLYDAGGAFTDGLAIVKRIDKYGCINKIGKEVIECVYDDIIIVSKTDVRVFHDGLWEVIDCYGNKVTSDKYIDSNLTLKVILPLIYQKCTYLRDGLVKIKMNDKYGIIKLDGDEVVPCIYDAIDYKGGWISVGANGKYGFLDITGKQIQPCVYDNAISFFSGWGVVEKDKKWGAINVYGIEIIPFDNWTFSEYSTIWTDNLIILQLRYSNKWGLADQTGRIIICDSYEYVGGDVGRQYMNQYADIDVGLFSSEPAEDSEVLLSYWEGMSPVSRDGLCGFIDENGEEVIPCKYKCVSTFNNGIARVKKDYYTWLFIDKGDNVILQLDYEGVSDFAEGLALVMRNGKCGYIDISGNEVIPCVYEKARLFNNGVAPVKNDKWVFIDKLGNVVSKELETDYDEVEMTESRLWRVYYSGKYGLIDMDGQEILPCIYKYIYKLADGVWRADLDYPYERCSLLIDDAGNLLSSNKYDGIHSWERNQGVIVAHLNGKDGLIDIRGHDIVPCVYEHISSLDGGMWKVRLNDKFGIMGNDGKIVVPCICDDIDKPYYSTELIEVRINGSSGIVEVTKP